MTKTQGILEAILYASQNPPELMEGEPPVKKLRIEFDLEMIDEEELKWLITQCKKYPFKPSWLDRQMKKNVNEVKKWPRWMKRAANIT